MSYAASGLIFSAGMGLPGAHQLNWLWDYTTTDPLADIEVGLGTQSSPYFTDPDAMNRLRTNDLLRVTASDGKGFYMVSCNGPLSSIVIVKLAVVSAFVPWTGV